MRHFFSLLAVASVALGGVALMRVDHARAQAAPPAAAQAAPQAGAWSVADCQTCHDAAAGGSFQRTPHAKQDQSCATCHQNVAEHAKAQMAGQTGGPVPTLKTLKAREVSAVCLTCHEKNNQLNFTSSMHDRRNVACTSCHSVHSFSPTRPS